MDTSSAARVAARNPAGAVMANGRGNESAIPGVSWAAVFAGAVAAAAVSMILVALGSGLGFASVSPWSTNNPSVTSFTVMAGVWLIITPLLPSGLARHLAGGFCTQRGGLPT